MFCNGLCLQLLIKENDDDDDDDDEYDEVNMLWKWIGLV